MHQEGEILTCHRPGLPVTPDKVRLERTLVLRFYPYEGTAEQVTPSSKNSTK